MKTARIGNVEVTMEADATVEVRTVDSAGLPLIMRIDAEPIGARMECTRALAMAVLTCGIELEPADIAAAAQHMLHTDGEPSMPANFTGVVSTMIEGRRHKHYHYTNGLIAKIEMDPVRYAYEEPLTPHVEPQGWVSRLLRRIRGQ